MSPVLPQIVSKLNVLDLSQGAEALHKRHGDIGKTGISAAGFSRKLEANRLSLVSDNTVVKFKLDKVVAFEFRLERDRSTVFQAREQAGNAPAVRGNPAGVQAVSRLSSSIIFWN